MTDEEEMITFEVPKSKAYKLYTMLDEVEQKSCRSLELQPGFWIGYLTLEEKLGIGGEE